MVVSPERHVAEIGGVPILFIMATEQEYGPALRRVIDPLMTGVGPVEAAAVTAATLARLEHRGRLPGLAVSLGSAGSRTLEHAGVYQIASVTYRDMDASALGVEKGVTPFLDHPKVVAIPHRIDGVPAASISTGGAIISGRGYDDIDADMVDMETYAVFRAAHRFGVPFVGLRGISDGKVELTGLHDWTAYLHIIDEKLAAIIVRLKDDIASGRFRLGGGAS